MNLPNPRFHCWRPATAGTVRPRNPRPRNPNQPPNDLKITKSASQAIREKHRNPRPFIHECGRVQHCRQRKCNAYSCTSHASKQIRQRPKEKERLLTQKLLVLGLRRAGYRNVGQIPPAKGNPQKKQPVSRTPSEIWAGKE